jgi:hypothetical protein
VLFLGTVASSSPLLSMTRSAVSPVCIAGLSSPLAVIGLCENFLYRFKAAPQGRSRRRHGGQASAPADAPAPARLNAGRLARKVFSRSGPQLKPQEGHRGRGGFDKGTLAAALIGLLRAGQKPARSANKRTGRRPLSNPPLRLRGAATP